MIPEPSIALSSFLTSSIFPPFYFPYIYSLFIYYYDFGVKALLLVSGGAVVGAWPFALPLPKKKNLRPPRLFVVVVVVLFCSLGTSADGSGDDGEAGVDRWPSSDASSCIGVPPGAILSFGSVRALVKEDG